MRRDDDVLLARPDNDRPHCRRPSAGVVW